MFSVWQSDNMNCISVAEKDTVEGKFSAESTRIVNGGGVSLSTEINLNDVPETPLLDTSANKGKAQLASSGALANRKPPTKAGALTVSFHVTGWPRHRENTGNFVLTQGKIC